MKPPNLGRDEIRAIERIVSKRFGEPYRQVEWLPLTIKQKRPRQYARHRLVAAEGAHTLWVFTKFGRKILRYPKLEIFLSGIDLEQFQAPKFMGVRVSSNFEIAVWEDRPGEWRNFEALTDAELDSLVDAVGAIHDLTDAVHDCGIPVGTPWLTAFMVEVHAYAAELGRSDLQAAADRVSELEASLLDRLQSMGDLVFTHNDIAPTNLHWRDDGLTILDWEGAAFALPGCGLRLTARLPEARFNRVVERYHRILERRGCRLTEDDLRYSIAAHEGVRSLVLGQRTRNAELLSWGLSCLHRHILKMDMKSAA